MKRDRFELLSAYLDGEVSPDERRQVEQWLDQDATTQQLYQRLLRLRQGFASVPTVGATEQSLDQFVNGVMNRIDQRSRRRYWVGTGAIAAVAIGALTTMILGSQNRLPQFAQQDQATPPELAATDSTAPAVASEGLQIALDRPILEIPKVNNKGEVKQPALQNSSEDVQ